MSEQKYSYRDTNLNFDQAYYYTLLLLVEATSFSVAVTHNNQLLAYETNCNLTELTEPQQISSILSASYKKTIIALSSSTFSLIPDAIFDPDHISDMAHLLDVKENERVLAQALDTKNHIIYKTSEQIWGAIGKFDLKNLVYSAKGWIMAITQNDKLNNKLYLNISSSNVDFLYLKDNAIRLYNTFEFKNADDVVYFSMFVTQELGITPGDANLVLSGAVTSEDKIYTGLADFFTHISFNPIQLLELPDQIPPQQILYIAALTLCGS